MESTFKKQVEAGGTGSPAIGRAVLAMIFLYNATFNIAWAPLQATYVVEILPFNLRARVGFLRLELGNYANYVRVWSYTTFLCRSHSSSTSIRTPSPSKISSGNVSVVQNF